MLDPVVAVELLPAGVCLPALGERLRSAGPRRRRRQRHGRPDEHQTLDALGVICAEQHRPGRAHRQRDDPRSVRAARVHHGKRVGDELRWRIRLGLGGPIRAAVPAAVERQHAPATREIRDLRLPHPRVDDRPGRQEQDRGFAFAVTLPEHPHAVALDIAGLIRVACSGLLAPGGAGCLGRGHLASAGDAAIAAARRDIPSEIVSGVWFETDSLSETSSATSAKNTEPGMKKIPCSIARSRSALVDHPSGSWAHTKIPPRGRVKAEPGGSTSASPSTMARIGVA